MRHGCSRMGAVPDLLVRDATSSDAAACAAIYGHYVEHSFATIELDL